MDAVVGINNLDLTAMRGNYCHCGFPEIAYGKYSDMLVARGYKVARIEQTETPDMRDSRNKGTGSKDKVVKREICRVTTASTKTYGVYDGTDDKNFIHTVEASASYLMALVEEQTSSKTSSYGLCFIDTSVGKFILTQFDDDSCRSVLRTVAAQFQPSHVIYPKGLVSSGTQAVFNSALSAVKKEPLFMKKEFYPEDIVVTKLMNPEYLGNDLDKWPKELNTIFDTTLHVPRSLPNKQLCVRALGGLMFYLNRCLIDVDMFSMGQFEEYYPPSLSKDENKPQISGVERWKGKNLVLDGATLLNLHLVPPFTGKKAAAGLRDATSLKFSLFNTIDSCKTPFGKRLLRSWICSPSCDPTVIAERQDAVEYLMRQDVNPLIKKMEEYLKKLPDLEKLLQKINTLGLKYRSETHPDSRAQMFFPEKYNKRKINDLILTLNGFERILKLAFAYSKLDIEK
uniref:DNA mismatch repair protein MutS core domain-containing protein n=1 Tax=Panagrolaimus sp. ES5 TaxID=591445 RepID=A0AC34G9Z1_9BILA